MGQCLRKGPKDHSEAQGSVSSRQNEVLSFANEKALCRPPKQDKNIDDKRMFKLGVDILNRDFCIQIGYNRKAVKTYGQGSCPVTPEGPPPSALDTNDVS